MEQEYTLTVIEDLETPLAATAGQPMPALFIAAIMVSVCLLFAVVAFFYMTECKSYQRIYERLYFTRTGEKVIKPCWNLSHLKEMILEEEAESASAMLRDEFGSMG